MMFTCNLLCDFPGLNIHCTSALFYCVSGDWITFFLCIFFFNISLSVCHCPFGADAEPDGILTYLILCGYVFSSPVCSHVNTVPC